MSPEYPITDIHSHILPDVDDGSPEMTQSIAMIVSSISQGIHHLFLTSHSFAYLTMEDSRRSHSIFEELDLYLQEHAYPIHLYLGCEILCIGRWMERIITALSTEQIPTMNHTNYVLIEFPAWDLSKDEILYCTEILLDDGWIPIFAHMERYADSFSDLAFVEQLKEMGCLIQMNLFSLVKEEDADIRKLSQLLLQAELVDFLGSDAHNMHHRPPDYQSGIQFIKKHCREDYQKKLFFENAKTYLKIRTDS